MAGTSLGTAWIQIKPTTSGITSAVKKELAGVEQEMTGKSSGISGAFSGLGKKAGAALKGALVASAAAATAGAVALVKNAVAEFANYEQLVGGVDTLFKDASSTVQGYAANAFQTAQLSANEYMETVTSFSASLLQSLGGDTAQAAKYADQAVIDMADNANKMGTDMAMIQNAYQGFAKQNYTMLDNLKLGYGGTKTEMERLLADAEKFSGIHYEIGNFADMTAAIHVVQEQLGIAGTSAKEASQTISGSLKSMKSAWSNLVVGIADGNSNLDVLIGNFVQSAGGAIQNLIPVIMTALQNIGPLVETLVPIITERLPALIETLVPPFINVVTQLTIAIVQSLPALVTSILEGVVAVLPDLINGIVEALPALIDALVGFFGDPHNLMLIIDAGVQLFMGLVKAVPQILGGLFNAFSNLFGALWNKVKTIFSGFASQFGDFISGAFKGAVNGVLSFLENIINGPINVINGFIGAINGAFGFIGVNLGRIQRISLPRVYAQGGAVVGPGTSTSDSIPAMLSNGEYVIRAAAAREIGYQNLDRMNRSGDIAGAGQTNYFTINGYNKSPEELANIISRKIAFNQRGVMG